MFKKISFGFVFALVFSFLSFVKPAAAAASIGLSPSSGQTSSNFTISGSEFTASLGVTVTWDGNSLGSGTADGSGNISISRTVPGDATVGSHTVNVTSASITKSDGKTRWAWIGKAMAVFQQPPSASATFTVVAPSGGGTGDEPANNPTPTSNAEPDSTPTSELGRDVTNTTTTTGTTSNINTDKSSMEVDKEEAIANGTDKIIICMILMNSKGEVIEGLTPTITVTGSDNTLSAVEYTNKKYCANLTSTKAEEKEISGTAGKEVDKLKVKFTAPVITAVTPATTTTTSSKCSAWWGFFKTGWLKCWWWILLVFALIAATAGYLYYRHKNTGKGPEDKSETQEQNM